MSSSWISSRPAHLMVTGLWLLIAVVSTGCTRTAEREPAIEAVTRTPPKLQPLTQPTNILVNGPPVASEGDCAPRYANGLTGTCINNQACRGFGVRTDKGEAICACYAKPGGCEPGYRCDTIRKQCVPEKEELQGRPRAR